MAFSIWNITIEFQIGKYPSSKNNNNIFRRKMLVRAVQKRAYLLNYFRGKPEREKRKERIKKGEQTKPCIIFFTRAAGTHN